MEDSAQFDTDPTPGTDEADQNRMTLADLKIGKQDSREREVLDLLWDVEEFKIYKTPVGISPFFSDDPDLGAIQKRAYVELGPDISAFNYLIHVAAPKAAKGFRRLQLTGTSDDNRNLFEREFARCIAQALLGHSEGAKIGLASLRSRLEATVTNQARVVHLLISLMIVAIVWLFALSLVGSGYEPRFGLDVKHIALSALMGSIGALFSTAVGLRHMQIDPTVTLSMHWVHGFQRMLVGMMGATIIYFGFTSGILAGIFQPSQTETDPATIDQNWLSFISVLAGFSERLVPNLLDGRVREAEENA